MKQITEKQIGLIGRRLNNKKELGEELEALKTEAEEEGVEVSKEQAEKGFNWLWNLYMSPTGQERRVHPYGFREAEMLEVAKKGDKYSFTYDGHIDAGNAYMSWFAPIYTFSSNGQSFQYYVKGGEIQIIG